MRTGKKYFKDGNPEVYAYLGEETWKRMTAKEKSMWTPYSEVDKAPISQEVIEFNKLREESSKKEQELQDEISSLKAQLAASAGETAEIPENEKLSERELLLQECEARGIKTTHNMKIETLRKRLADAND